MPPSMHSSYVHLLRLLNILYSLVACRGTSRSAGKSYILVYGIVNHSYTSAHLTYLHLIAYKCLPDFEFIDIIQTNDDVIVINP